MCEVVVVSERSEVRWGDEGPNDSLDDGEEGDCQEKDNSQMQEDVHVIQVIHVVRYRHL